MSVRCAGPTAFSPLPVVSPLPVLPAFMPGATDVRVSQGDMQVLGPGSYAAVTLFKHATPTGLRNFVLPQQLCTTNGTFPIDPDVADGITTVADLLTLADQALRNSLAFNQNDPITRSDITAALDAINRGFDNCASVVTCP